MNKQIEALKMAIEALESIELLCDDKRWYLIGSARKACKEALAEAEKKEPVGKMCLGCGTSMSDEKLEEKKRHNKYLVSCCPDRQMVDVYTHHAIWQSLSDDNILKLFKPKFECEIEDFELIDFSRAIEQALKEKNHG